VSNWRPEVNFLVFVTECAHPNDFSSIDHGIRIVIAIFGYLNCCAAVVQKYLIVSAIIAVPNDLSSIDLRVVIEIGVDCYLGCRAVVQKYLEVTSGIIALPNDFSSIDLRPHIAIAVSGYPCWAHGRAPAITGSTKVLETNINAAKQTKAARTNRFPPPHETLYSLMVLTLTHS